MPAKFTVPPAPIRSPLEFDQNGLITSQAWIAWLLRIVTPVLQMALASETSVDRLLALGKHAPEQSGAELNLMLPQNRAAAPSPQFPPTPPRPIPQDSLPPPVSRQFATELLPPIRQSQQLQPWVVADTLANQSKYPNSSFPVDALFVATDKNLLYYNTGTAWVQVPAVPASATVLASNSSNQIIAASLTNTKFWIGSAGNLPVEQALSGDATLAAGGALTLAAVGPGAATHTVGLKLTGGGVNGTITIDAKGRITAIQDAT